MNESLDKASSTASLDAEAVATFLREQPEFFNQHSALLLELEIPHPSGEAVSLFERQLTVLREENRQLKTNIHTMIENARTNEALIKRIHGLVLQLMEATGPHAIFSTLREQLKEHFNADRVAVLVFATPSFVEVDGPTEFIGRGEEREAIFKQLLANDNAVCGLTDSVVRQTLWPDEPSFAGSNALLPLKAGTWQGVIAIQSDDDERFTAEMGTEFLSYISDIVCLIIDPWVVREPGK